MNLENSSANETKKNYNLVYLLIFFSSSLTFASIMLVLSTMILAIGSIVPVIQGYLYNIVAFASFISVFYIVVLMISVYKRKELLKILKIEKFLMVYLVYIAVKLANIFKLDSKRIARSFIEIHNDFVVNKVKNQNIKGNFLLLLPHCLQLHSCALKITGDINNCKKCGRCVISNILGIKEKFSIDVFVSTGGTMARKVIKEKRPELIIAVACERDLLSGIKDTIGLPVIGVLNKIPNEPCFNTTVNVDSIEQIITELLPSVLK